MKSLIIHLSTELWVSLRYARGNYFSGVSICGCNWWGVQILPAQGSPWNTCPLNELCTADLPSKSLLQLHHCWECFLALISSEGSRLKSRFPAGGNLNHHPDMESHLSYLVTEHISTNHFLHLEHLPSLLLPTVATPPTHVIPTGVENLAAAIPLEESY